MVPDVGGDGVEGKVSNNAIVGATTFEGLPEVRMGGGSGVDNGRVGQDDFELVDIVTGKAVFGGEEGDSNWSLLEPNLIVDGQIGLTSQNQTANANIARASTNGSKAILFQPAVDLAPSVSSPKSDCLVVLAETGRVETAHVNQHTVVNAGETDILLVTATARRKLGSQRGNNLETKSNIGGRVGFKETCRVEPTGFRTKKSDQLCGIIISLYSSTYIGRSTSAV